MEVLGLKHSIQAFRHCLMFDESLHDDLQVTTLEGQLLELYRHTEDTLFQGTMLDIQCIVEGVDEP
jgi:hypothetical protein|tara:strand:+ start:185 stop:382 length:198 start_codon:yes stop_codon:yes gene_type:complete